MVGARSAHGGEVHTGVLVGKSEEKRPRVRSKRSWQKNFNNDLLEVGWEDMDWIDLAQNTSRWPAI